MGRYSGIKYRIVKRILIDNGWESVRRTGSHVRWRKGSQSISITNGSGGVNQMMVRRLFKENNISPIPQ